jgi:hypothetical protein
MNLKDKQRVIMKVLLLNKCAGNEIVTDLQNVYGEGAYS